MSYINLNNEYPNIIAYKNDISNLYKYANDVEINPQKTSIFDGFGVNLAVFGAFEGGSHIFKKCKKNYLEKYIQKTENKNLDKAGELKRARKMETLKKMETAEKLRAFENKELLEKTKGAKSFAERYKICKNISGANKINSAIEKSRKMGEVGKEAEAYYTRAKNLAEAAKANTSRASKYLGAAERNLLKGRLATKVIEHEPTTLFGKIGKFFGKTLGLAKVGRAIESAAVKNPIIGKVLKIGRSVKSWAIIQGSIELCTKVIPTFVKYGFKNGMKQLGQSAAKTLVSSAGWEGGALVGAEIGTAIFPGLGTGIGALCGFIGGLAGSYLASKVADKVVGEDQYDICEKEASEEAAKSTALKTMKNPADLQNDKTFVAAVDKLKVANTNSPDVITAKRSLANITDYVDKMAKDKASSTTSSAQSTTANSNQGSSTADSTQGSSNFGNLTLQSENASGNAGDYTQNSFANSNQQNAGLNPFNNGFNYNYNSNNSNGVNPFMLQAMYQQMYGQNPFGNTYNNMSMMPQMGNLYGNMYGMNMLYPNMMNNFV